MDAADTDDNGGSRPNITDAIRILNWLFLGEPRPSAPSPTSGDYQKPGDCGFDPEGDPDDAMDCQAFVPCP